MEMELSPKQIVEELDKYIIGQTNAKKSGCNSNQKPLSQKQTCPRTS